MTTGFTADDLSAHTDFLQRLAASLLRDPEGARDVAQDALVAALEHPPRRGGELRGWLATVTRNLARNRVRSEGNRERREASAARAEAHGDVQDIAQRMEVQRLVCEAVFALDEPRREAIYLRYFEGLTPDEIARRVGAPVKTVQSRLNRGLAELRERLDRHFGGERRRWTLALVPLVRRSSGAASAGGVGALAWLGAAALLASLGAWVALRGAAGAPPVEPVALGAASAVPPPVVAAVVSAPVTPARASLTTPPLETALVVHLRWEADGSPAAGLGLDLACANDPAPRETRVRAVTDAGGSARFEALVPGPVSLHLDRGASFEGVAVAGETRELEFLVLRGEDVRGRVLTADGAPLAGATLWGEDVRALYPDPWPLGVSASDGSFRLREPAPLLRICARASGHLPSSSARVMDLARAADGTRTLELVVGDGGQSLEGRVLAPDGSPVPDAVVWIGSKSSLGTIDAAGQMREAPGAERVLTDTDGRFRSLAHLGAGVHDVVALAPGFPAWIGDVESDGVAQLAPLEIRLLAPATVRGSVTTPDGAPVAGAELTLVERGEAFSIGGQTSVIDPRRAPPLRTRTDASGAFELSWIGPEQRLTAAAPARPELGRAETTLRLAPLETSTVELVLESIPSIAGRVVDGAGQALAGRKVQGLPSTRGYPLPSAVTDAEGRFTLPALAPCSYRVSVLTERGAPCTGAMAEPGTSALELVVADPAPDSSRVHGLLFEADGRVPADAQALLYDLGKQCGYMMAPAPTTGRFESIAVPAGRYRLQAQRGLRVVAVGEAFELASEQDRDCGTMLIPLAGELELTTTGAGEFAWAMLEREGFGRVSMVDENGRIEARELAPGSWTLRAQSPERFAAERTVEIRAGERASVAVAFEPGASVILVLRADEETRYASDVALEARDATGRLLTRQVSEHGALGWQAEQSLCLPLGAVSVEATTTTGKRGSVDLEVGEPFQRVELVLR